MTIARQYREAFEEVGLPLGHPDVHTLCTLRPFIAWTRSFVLVTPVVSLLTDLSTLDTLKPAEDEVDLIFDHPLEAILEPALSDSEPLVDLNSELWPSEDKYYVRTRPSSECALFCTTIPMYLLVT